LLPPHSLYFFDIVHLIIIKLLIIDLFSTINTGGEETNERRMRELLRDVGSLRLTANFKDSDDGFRTSAELLAVAHYSPNNQHLRVYTTTKQAKVKMIK
jgi:hypothetical protein